MKIEFENSTKDIKEKNSSMETELKQLKDVTEEKDKEIEKIT